MNRQMKNKDDDFDSEHIHPLFLPSEEKPKRKYEDILMDAIGFTEDELELNRAGQISKDQWGILYDRRNNWLIGIALLGFSFVVLWAFADGSISYLHLFIILGIVYCG